MTKRVPGVAAERRLSQAHDLWHRALHVYPDADAFLVHINALIQALRSVTWLLQADKALIPDFDAWYANWQDRMRADPVLRWLVQARNSIEKEGDLDLQSTARVSVIASWLPTPVDEFDVPPLLAPELIARALSERGIPEPIRKAGVLRVERRWITKSLPDVELLEATAYVTAYFDALLRDLTERADEAALIQPRECMATGAQARTADLHLSTGEFLRFEKQWHEFPDDVESAATARYGDILESLEAPPEGLEGRAGWYHEIGKKMLARDGAHPPTALLFRDGVRVATARIEPADQQEKYVLMQLVADEAARIGANELILLSEYWGAPLLPEDDDRGALRPADREDRVEGFLTHAISRSGTVITFQSEMRRADTGIEFGPTHVLRKFPNILLPVRRAWSRA